MATTEKLPSRLHHNAYLTKDQEATRAFYEDIIGLPLVATWSEADELFGVERVYCHTFFGLGDGSALAFFQFANQSDQDLFDPELTPSPFRHIALRVTPELQQEIHDRLTTSAWKPEGTYVLEHGYCRSLYTEDPNGLLLEFTVDVPEADEIAAERRSDAHETLKRWLAGDHTSNNVYRYQGSLGLRSTQRIRDRETGQPRPLLGDGPGGLRRRGRCRRLSALTDVSAACTVTFTAATVLPDASRLAPRPNGCRARGARRRGPSRGRGPRRGPAPAPSGSAPPAG